MDSAGNGGPDGSVTVQPLSEWRQSTACCAGRRELSRTVNQRSNPPSFLHLLLSLRLRRQLGDTMFDVTVPQFSGHRMMLLLPLHCTLLSESCGFHIEEAVRSAASFGFGLFNFFFFLLHCYSFVAHYVL